MILIISFHSPLWFLAGVEFGEPIVVLPRIDAVAVDDTTTADRLRCAYDEVVAILTGVGLFCHLNVVERDTDREHQTSHEHERGDVGGECVRLPEECHRKSDDGDGDTHHEGDE